MPTSTYQIQPGTEERSEQAKMRFEKKIKYISCTLCSWWGLCTLLQTEAVSVCALTSCQNPPLWSNGRVLFETQFQRMPDWWWSFVSFLSTEDRLQPPFSVSSTSPSSRRSRRSMGWCPWCRFSGRNLKFPNISDISKRIPLASENLFSFFVALQAVCSVIFFERLKYMFKDSCWHALQRNDAVGVSASSWSGDVDHASGDEHCDEEQFGCSLVINHCNRSKLL